MELAHTVTGSGPTLVLVHGIVHRQHGWDAIVPELSKSRRVITVDLPGHGASPAIPAGSGVDVLVDELEQFIRQVTPADGQVHIAGNSLGGWLALEMAARGAVSSATAISPAGFFRGAWDQKRVALLFKFMRLAARPLAKAPGLLRNPVVRTLALGAIFAKPWRVPSDLAQIDLHSLLANQLIDQIGDTEIGFTTPVDPTVPVTVLWGTRDLVLPIYEAAGVTAVFPQAQLIRAKGLGHTPMFDDPAQIVRVLVAGSAESSPVRRTA